LPIEFEEKQVLNSLNVLRFNSVIIQSNDLRKHGKISPFGAQETEEKLVKASDKSFGM